MSNIAEAPLAGFNFHSSSLTMTQKHEGENRTLSYVSQREGEPEAKARWKIKVTPVLPTRQNPKIGFVVDSTKTFVQSFTERLDTKRAEIAPGIIASRTKHTNKTEVLSGGCGGTRSELLSYSERRPTYNCNCATRTNRWT